MNKAYQYGRICDADVFVGIRLRKSGRMFTFADTKGFWSSFVSQLALYYPTPVHQTEKNFEIIHEKGEDTNSDGPKEAITERKIEH
ncbi:uncharacterized protein BDW43DRAFT_293818 [Aspergillus alliaceus]|uniref:uncharacterized protein n=1 Tax=Petromyces alliaceus TaxID=209559 RepID=UPI0012A4404E|nr:uncharacterized protein BDW43DRAFT_293818 [Aspergillus alliaceus]KAB8227560.1 hypothetical protein BDW43DRAFT_293818 [Aspergillus alliaceus]